MSAQTRSEIVSLLDRHGLAPVHRLGQHFLADANVTRKIVDTADPGPGSKVVEVGAGTGTLSRALAGSGAHVVAYEVDEGLRPVLDDVTSGFDIEVRFADVTDVDLQQDLDGDGWSMVANLPYNVGTPVVLNALRHVPAIDRFVVMVQKEVARRFTAEVGSDAYGLPSVIARLHSEAKLAFTVPPQVFYPPPQVESAVVVMDRIEAPALAERAIDLARAAFGQRRKMLRRSLSQMLPEPLPALRTAGIDPTLRAEDLSVDAFIRLAEVST